MTIEEARILVRVLLLLNSKPRFSTRWASATPFDSYSIAAEIEELLQKYNFDPYSADLHTK